MALSADLYTVVETPSLAARTTIRLGGEAIAEVRLHSTEGIDHLPGLLARVGGQIRVIGEGSNIIAAEERLPLVLVNFERHADPVVFEKRGESVLIRVDAGMRLPSLLAWAARHGFSGLEGLAGVPGSVGGAVAMNAGSFGVEFWRFVRKVGLFSPALGLVERDPSDFAFSYRHCRLRGHPDWFLVTDVTVALTRGKTEHIRTLMRDIYIKKQASQPVVAKSAGCVFKNPAPDAPAGKLLDEAGFRGYHLGGMYFSMLHANFLVNEGSGTFAQAMELIEMARSRVLESTGWNLELEVQIWR